MGRRSDNPILELGRNYAEAYDQLRNDFRIGETGKWLPRPKGAAASGSNADYHWRIESRYYLAMERARHWSENNPFVAPGLERLAVNVLGEEGPTLQPACSDEGLRKELNDRFLAWADDPQQCDLQGNEDLWGLSYNAFLSTLTDGDILGVPLKDGPLQVYEGHRIRTPSNTNRKMVLGCLLNDFNRIEEVWVSRDDVGLYGSIRKVAEVNKYAVRDADGFPSVFFPRHRRRNSATRGVTPLAPATDPIEFEDRIQFAALVKAQIANCWGILRTREGATERPSTPPSSARGGTNDPQIGSRSNETRDDGTVSVIEDMKPGMDIRARDGEKIQAFSANIPNAEFFPHAMMVLTFVAINLKLPLCVLLLDPSQTNFSGYRGALGEAQKSWRKLQKWFTAHWFTPIYQWKLRQFAAEDASLRRKYEANPLDYLAHAWHSPGWDYIDPMKDATSDLLQVGNSLISQSRRCGKRNIVWDSEEQLILKEREQSIRRAVEISNRLNTELSLVDSEKVSWREVAAMPRGDMGIKIDPYAGDQTPDTAAPIGAK